MIVKKYVTDIFNKKYYVEEEIKIEENLKEENNIINVHPEKTYQEWLGLGGALTNSTTYNLDKLSEEKKNALLKDYFKELNYNFIRIPLGSTDFSVKSEENYSADFETNVNVLKKIKEFADFQTILTPWSPPKKFKTKNSLYGGSLKKESYEEYANYLIKAISDYEFMNINIDFLSPQNEPFASQFWESCKFTLEDLKEFIYKYLVPKLKNTKIILWDHNKDNLYNNFKSLYENNSKIAGVAFHWYTGSFFEEMDLIRENYPNIWQIETEMCCGFSRYNSKKWVTDAEYYLTEIINGIHHGLNAFLDWNMLLNYRGGPNHKFNNCKSAIILNRRQNNYIKTPIYWYLKHIGVVGKAKAISTSKFARDCSIDAIALKNEHIYIIVQNKSKHKQKINLRIGNNVIKDKINKHSIITYKID